MGNEAGRRGTFVLAWGQTEIDGVPGAPPSMLYAGAQWRWWGGAVRIAGEAGLLLLDEAIGEPIGGAALRARASLKAGRLLARAGLGAVSAARTGRAGGDDDGESGSGFTVTDGRRSYTVGMSPAAKTGWLALFAGDVPPTGVDLHVVECRCGETGRGAVPVLRGAENPRPTTGEGAVAAGVICFTPGTRIATPDGARAIELIRPGDRISTKDDGAQEVLWTGARRMSGARLYALPHLRPVRIRAGAMGEARPEGDLIVSPQHRMLVTGAQARALFNHDEVLVAAHDLIDERTILTETALSEVTYVHLMTARHQIVWANGLETESFHPANTDLDLIAPDQRAALLSVVPGLDADPLRYGGHARRNLSAPEAAILRHGAH